MFNEDKSIRISSYKKNEDFIKSSRLTTQKAMRNGFSYNFDWLGFKIIQFPEDIQNLQQIIFNEKPSCIIETGLAHGGSAILAASILNLVHLTSSKDNALVPKVHCIELEVLQKTKEAIEKHFFSKMINIYQGSSINKNIYKALLSNLREGENPLVILDSCHTTEHVLGELMLYSRLTPSGGSLIVCDTSVGIVGPAFDNCKYGVSFQNNPLLAVESFLKTEEGKDFYLNDEINDGLLLSSNFSGYLKRK
ncbi:cephalosporin hydroxylase family protein [Prochlorococcus sp. AH-716-B20]|nr:cephalosporin hydroxylase family protein [Prochlorococcus sp. AH-716-B20]